MTLVLTCPRSGCEARNPLGETHCRACGKGLLPVRSPRLRRHRCPYCERFTNGRACSEHRDLPARDPYYVEARL